MSGLQEITIKNINLTRKWGWGWSCTPTGEDAWTIKEPTRPNYTGTLNQIGNDRGADRNWKSMQSGGTFTNSLFFYDGKPVRSTWTFGILNGKIYDDPDAKWGYGWFVGLHLPEDGEESLKIRVQS